MKRHLTVNLQLFAEGETNPDETKVESNDNKQEKEPVNPFDRLYTSKFTKSEPETKEPEKKEDLKPEDKREDIKTEASKELETKEPEKKDDEFIPIKHLGKEVKIPVTERDKYLQMGYDYGHVKQEAENAKTTLKRIAQAEGFKTVDEYLTELDGREKAKLAEQIEEAVGDPEKINEIVQNHPVVKQTREEKQKLEFEKVKMELSKDEFFKELESQFDDLMVNNPTANPNLVYSVLVGDYVRSDTYKQKLAKEKELAEQEKEKFKASVEKKIINDVHDKERRTMPKGGDTGDGKDIVQPTDFTKKLAGIFFGNDSNKYATKIAQRAHERMKRS